MSINRYYITNFEAETQFSLPASKERMDVVLSGTFGLPDNGEPLTILDRDGERLEVLADYTIDGNTLINADRKLGGVVPKGSPVVCIYNEYFHQNVLDLLEEVDQNADHERLHGLNDVSDHAGVADAAEDNVVVFDDNGLPKDGGMPIHARSHTINSGDDHTGVPGATPNNFMGIDGEGLPKDSGSKASDFATTGHGHSDLHTKSHNLNSTDDHAGLSMSENNLLAADNNGLPKDAGRALADLANADHAHPTVTGDDGTRFLPIEETGQSNSSPAIFEMRLTDGTLYKCRLRGIIRYTSSPQLAVDFWNGTTWNTEQFIVSLSSGATESKNASYAYRFVSGGLGSTTSPAFSPGGDSNTGLFFNGAGSMHVAADGEKVATFKQGGLTVAEDIENGIHLAKFAQTISGNTWSALSDSIAIHPDEILDIELDITGISEDGRASGDYASFKKRYTAIRDAGASPGGAVEILTAVDLAESKKTGSVLDVRLVAGTFPSTHTDLQPLNIEVKGVESKNVRWSVRATISSTSKPDAA